MMAAANVHPSHFHIVAAAIVKEQEEIRLRIQTLINDPDAKDLAHHRASVEAYKRMSRHVEQQPPNCRICKQLLLEDTKVTLYRSPRVCQQTSTSILPPELFDLWPRILEHLLQRPAQLHRLLERVERILTRETRAKTAWNAIWGGTASPEWAAMIASGLCDRVELQLLMEMMFSNMYGTRQNPSAALHEVFNDGAAMKGWQMPAIRIWEGGEADELPHQLHAAGFRTEVLAEAHRNPDINPSTVMVVTTLTQIKPLITVLELSA